MIAAAAALPALLESLLQFLIPFCRFAAFLMAAPIFGTLLVPMRVRLVLAIALTLGAWDQIDGSHDINDLVTFSPTLLLLVGHEVLIGVALAFATQLFFHLFVIGGQVIAMQMGLGFAAMIDPANGVSLAVVSQLFTMLVTLLFLTMNGHLVLFEVLITSYELAPNPLLGGTWDLVSMAAWMFGGGLLIALPAVAALLMVNLTFGVMTRSAPQMNIFSLGFPMMLILGTVVLWLALGDWLPRFDRLSLHFFELLRQLAGLG